MRLTQTSRLSLLGMFALLLIQLGCVERSGKPKFYSYCDNTGCYQCDEQGCGRLNGLPPGSNCQKSADCAPGCFCGTDRKCAEAGFCDKQSDCAKGTVCNTARHSCEPGSGGGDVKPSLCKVGEDCPIGAECVNARCQALPKLPNACVFNRECGKGGICQDGLCMKACVDGSTCGTGRACTTGVCRPVSKSGDMACTASSQCGAGQTCINGNCHGSCTKDTECQARNANDVCTSGLCRPDERRVAECKMNAGCMAGQECVNAQCRDFCFATSDCAGCPGNNTVCLSGYCSTQREANPGCRAAPDCQGTAHCVDGACAK